MRFHIGLGGGGGLPMNRPICMQCFTLYISKIEVSETISLDILATHNDQPSHVKHDLGSIYVFLTPVWACGGHKGVVHNPLMQSFTL